MKKLASVMILLAIVSAVGCSNWSRYTGGSNDDKAIEAEIRKNMLGDRITGMSIKSSDGVVTLEGDVKDANEKQKALDDATKVKGVKSVIDKIAIKP